MDEELKQIELQISELISKKNSILSNRNKILEENKQNAIKELGTLVQSIKENIHKATNLCDEYSLSFDLNDVFGSYYGWGAMSYWGKGALISDERVLPYYQASGAVSAGEWRASSDMGC